MKPNIHPKYQQIKVVCSCGNTFETSSTVTKNPLNIEVCSNCHPFYTKKKKNIGNEGRVQIFQKKYKTSLTKVTEQK